jgi:peptidylprolyl isomerase
MRRLPHYALGLLALFGLLPLGCSGPEPGTASTSGEKLSDVQIEVLTPGTGEGAKLGDKVEVHYIGWLKGSAVAFDNSFNRQEPFTVELGKKQVIAGWEKGLEGMKVGERRRLTIPPELAYGKQGQRPKIPPDATLVFEVVVQSINKTETPAAPATGTDAPPSFKPPEKLADVKTEVLTPGTGEGAKPGDQLEVHYSGWLLNGDKFDSSRDRQKPFTLTLGRGQVIVGWDRGLVGMKVGELRRLTIPSQLAYGARGSPPTIPPDATLIFQIELLKNHGQ